jgi:hypothetical protein
MVAVSNEKPGAYYDLICCSAAKLAFCGNAKWSAWHNSALHFLKIGNNNA